MSPEHIKTHIRLNLTRLPDYASVRSEIETFLKHDSRVRIPMRMDIGSLNVQKGVCRKLWTERSLGGKLSQTLARVVARVMMMARGQGKKGKFEQRQN